ncbi:hypothetical protein DERP_001831 [Dermatophagoides pteronyssinus]|uniref:Uncharacterized protein n=1 Tax=Dermatophagoides pteronyssinus TaxID=6956 RepID=A0ABQ8JBR8_DERPT|nr:hypothetical protein DERP_001831 [Dermatophagoides pteronyssinus]
MEGGGGCCKHNVATSNFENKSHHYILINYHVFLESVAVDLDQVKCFQQEKKTTFEIENG